MIQYLAENATRLALALGTLGFMLMALRVCTLSRHERAHCAQLGDLQDEAAYMRRLLNIDDGEMDRALDSHRGADQ